MKKVTKIIDDSTAGFLQDRANKLRKANNPNVGVILITVIDNKVDDFYVGVEKHSLRNSQAVAAVEDAKQKILNWFLNREDN